MGVMGVGEGCDNDFVTLFVSVGITNFASELLQTSHTLVLEENEILVLVN